MNQKIKSHCCYRTEEGQACAALADFDDFCFWHSPSADKKDPKIKDRLEAWAHSGKSMEGFELSRADLSGINLVNTKSSEGYNLSHANLYRANLEKAHLFALDLTGTSLMKANLARSNLHCVNLNDANLLGTTIDHAKLEMIMLGKNLIQEKQGNAAKKSNDINMAREYYQQAEEIYRNLRSTSTRLGLFEHAGEYFHREMVMRRKQRPIWDPNRILSLWVDVFCGYGEKPLRVIFFSLMLISAFALGYAFTGLEDKGKFIAVSQALSFDENLEVLSNSFYFSVVTFTTLGFGDIVPVGLTRLLAASQAFVGSFTMALFVVVFVKKVTR